MARLRIQKLSDLPWPITKWRKKPLSVIAIQVDAHVKIEIPTLEGTMVCKKGDYVVQGIAGEIYPVKKHIFEKLYDKE